MRGEVLFKQFKFLKPFSFSIVIILIVVFLQSIAQLYLPTLMADIVDTGIVKGDTSFIIRIGGIMILIAAGGVICTITASYLSAKVGAGYGKIVRNKIFSRVESFSLHEFEGIGTASLITRTTNDITQIQQVLIIILRVMLGAPLMCIGGIVMAVSKDAKLSLVLVVVVPILALAILLIASKGVPLFKIMQKKIDKLNLVVRERLIGVRVIRAFNRINHENKRFEEANRDLTNTAIKVNKIMAALMPIMMMTLNLTTVAIVWFGGIRIDNGSMQVGDMMAFIQYAMQIMYSLIMVSMMFVMLPRASASAVRVNEVLDTMAEIQDPDNALTANEQIANLEFKDVTFSYPGAEESALKNISFATKAGEVTAIIGGTGSGKSTLINLIPRFYDIDSGSILVNGVDLRNITQKELREKIGLVPQSAILFTGTITDNILFGKQNASEEEIKKAGDIAQATGFIMDKEEAYLSLISQGGTNISGGQKQRLSIARAIVRKPEVYIFDDSFSALDFKTDAQLRLALRNEIKDSTVLIVAQRVSSVMNADRIIVLDEGEMAGIGTHKELLKSCKVYREIVSSQLSEEELA